MPDPIPPLLGLHAFESSARHMSFAAAADELHLSPSAISQRVRVLERHLGSALFERRPRSLLLTDAGQAYLPAVRDLFEDLAAATDGVFGHVQRTTLTVRVQASYASTWLAPRLPTFCAELPHVNVHLITSIWADALPPSQIDLEIRQGNGSWPGFRATKLHDDHAVAVCGPAHLERYGDTKATDLADRPRVQVLGFDDTWRHLFAASAPSAPARATAGPPAVITVDTSLAALDVVAASELWSIVPERFARQSVRAGRVVHVADSAVRLRQSHYLLHRDNADRLTRECEAFEGWLRTQDAQDPPLVAS